MTMPSARHLVVLSLVLATVARAQTCDGDDLCSETDTDICSSDYMDLCQVSEVSMPDPDFCLGDEMDLCDIVEFSMNDTANCSGDDLDLCDETDTDICSSEYMDLCDIVEVEDTDICAGEYMDLCEISEAYDCKVAGGAGCATCVTHSSRTAEDHCASCNPGYELNGTYCEAYECKVAGGAGCATCVTQESRTTKDHCASCNPGYELYGTMCEAIMDPEPEPDGALYSTSIEPEAEYGCIVAGGTGCATCIAQVSRVSDADCASCNPGYELLGTDCQAYGCNVTGGSGCATCVAQESRTSADDCASCNTGYELKGTNCQEIGTVTTEILEAVTAGTSTLRLADISGLVVGMLLTISGGGKSETKTIVAVNPDSSPQTSRRLAVSGTITLDGVLQHSYPKGASIVAKAVDPNTCSTADTCNSKYTMSQQWLNTIDVAKTQRVFIEKMSKEFFLVALNKEEYKAKVQSSVASFDKSFQDLTDGNSDLGILGASATGLTSLKVELLNIWTPFKATLLDFSALYYSNGAVNPGVIDAVRGWSHSLYIKSEELVNSLARVGEKRIALGEYVAIRQEALIQRLAKEAFLVALGFDVEADVATLDDAMHVFRDSHSGLVLGLSYAGIPTMTNVCIMREMSLVSKYWKLSLALYDPILVAESTEVSKSLALASVTDVISRTDSLYEEMLIVAHLYTHPTDDCNYMSNITDDQWRTMIGNVGKQRYLGEVVTQNFMQIVLGVQPQNSRVTLTVETVNAQANIRKIMEGDQAADSPTAPSQQILDMVQHGYKAWSDMKVELDVVVTTGNWNAQSVERMSAMNKIHLYDMNNVADMFVEQAKKYAPSVPAVQMNKVGHNRELFQEIAVEACLVNYGLEVKYNWDAINSSIDTWYEDMWILLEGSQSYGFGRMNDVCVVQEMKLAKDQFVLFVKAVFALARGNVSAVNDIIQIGPVADGIMQKLESMYSNDNSANSTCEPVHNTAEMWQEELIELGKFRAMTQGVVFDLYCDILNNTVCDTDECDLCCDVLTGGTYMSMGVDALDISLKKLKFGDGAIPAPHSQYAYDAILDLSDSWPSFRMKLSTQDANESDVASAVMLAGVEYLIAKDLADDDNYAHWRMDVMSKQLLLSKRILKEAAEQALNVRDSSSLQAKSLAKLQSSMNEFDAKHYDLSAQASEVAERTGRNDISNQMNAVGAKWAALKDRVNILAGITISADQNRRLIVNPLMEKVESVRQASNELDVEINQAVRLFGKSDPPDIPPKPPGPPWTLIVYAIIAGLMCILCGSACYNAGVCQRQSSQSSTGEFADAKKKSKKTEQADTTSEKMGIRESAKAGDPVRALV